MLPAWTLAILVVLSASVGCSRESVQEEAQRFLDTYSSTYQGLDYAASLADWESNTRIVEGDETNATRTRQAKQALADFTGGVENIETCRRLLSQKAYLTPIQVRQLEALLYKAADKPQIVSQLVRRRIAVETDQIEKLYGFTYRIEGEEVSTNQIDELLRSETDLSRRLSAWEASKRVGGMLRSGLEQLQKLRNETVQALDYRDFFTYQVSEYGMSRSEMMELMGQINQDVRPLYRELHTWARHHLAARYGQSVPDLIPAHWLPNRWGQDWSPLVSISGLDLDSALEERTPEWLMQQAERFYVSLGFDPLPQTFYERSSLYPLPPGAGYKKNNHASAWHLDLASDVRSLMSVENDASWYETIHHELGHVYYFVSYSNPDVPLLLRTGANRAFHEGIGSLMGFAAMQPGFLTAVGLASNGNRPAAMQTLLKEAINYLVFIPWSAGVMTEFEHDLYAAQLPPAEWNRRWWELKARYQGIAPPGERDDAGLCDPATKTHISDDPGQYYDYALSYLLLFQLHDHIAREVLKEDVRDTNYFGRAEVGQFLKAIMGPGATADWRALLRETTGQEISARALLNYFQPLMEWLQEQNRGRRHTLPEL